LYLFLGKEGLGMSTSVINLSKIQQEHGGFIEKVLKMSGQDVRGCYQCGKCSAGCAVHIYKGMDVSPNRIMRMVQLGMEEQVLRTKTIWTCVLCSTCTARCPRDIDIARVMDALRILSKQRQTYTVNAKNANTFHDIFMNSISRFGRVYEAGLAVSLTLKTGYGFNLLGVAPAAMMKGTLPFFPPKVKNSGNIKQIMENIQRMEGEKS
jgi:heterodisulfide reductase subunit C